ncbi:uncharacterized protein A4U43_C01F23600 [Asparagus officinalis]|uniref:Dolichyl-diphosphooligosaccharide-protein glycosyltransferase subunit OST5 n=1 Tax=Asparagus officinalis TaxID=4686 RepID=A0A5P1FV66_ASPOF|nr:uncharacterized protein A4U43_C01F23600 [Asparagus officinalis]
MAEVAGLNCKMRLSSETDRFSNKLPLYLWLTLESLDPGKENLLLVYETTSSKRNRCLAKEIATGAIASVFLGFGSLFLLLSTGVYV